MAQRCRRADMGADPPAAQAGPSLVQLSGDSAPITGAGPGPSDRNGAAGCGAGMGQKAGGADSSHTLEPKAGAGTLEPRWATSRSGPRAPRPACPPLRPPAPHRRPLRSDPPSSLLPTEPGPRGPGVLAGSASSPGLHTAHTLSVHSVTTANAHLAEAPSSPGPRSSSDIFNQSVEFFGIR